MGVIKSIPILGRECAVVPMSANVPDVLVCGLRYGIVEILLVIVNSGEHARVDATVGLRGAKGETVTITKKPGLRKAIDWAEAKAKVILTESSQLLSEFVWTEMVNSTIERLESAALEQAAKRNGEAS